jgi:hypothetical protein
MAKSASRDTGLQSAGGRFCERVRFYRTIGRTENPEDLNSWRQIVREAKAEKFGWTAFKF